MQAEQVLERYRRFFASRNTIAPEPNPNGTALARWAAILDPISEPSDPHDPALIGQTKFGGFPDLSEDYALLNYLWQPQHRRSAETIVAYPFVFQLNCQQLAHNPEPIVCAQELPSAGMFYGFLGGMSGVLVYCYSPAALICLPDFHTLLRQGLGLYPYAETRTWPYHPLVDRWAIEPTISCHRVEFANHICLPFLGNWEAQELFYETPSPLADLPLLAAINQYYREQVRYRHHFLLGYHDAENTSQTLSEEMMALRNDRPQPELLPGYHKYLLTLVSRGSDPYFSVGDAGFVTVVSTTDKLAHLKASAEQAIQATQPFVSVVGDFSYGE